MKPVRVKDVMTESELREYEELNYFVLTSATRKERDFYNNEIQQLISKVKTRYSNSQKKIS